MPYTLAEGILGICYNLNAHEYDRGIRDEDAEKGLLQKSPSRSGPQKLSVIEDLYLLHAEKKLGRAWYLPEHRNAIVDFLP